MRRVTLGDTGIETSCLGFGCAALGSRIAPEAGARALAAAHAGGVTWFDLAPPKGKKDHWVDGRSAKELAKAWVGSGVVQVPAELTALFATHPQFANLELVEAEPEARVRFDTHEGEPRNADLTIIARVGDAPVAISIEAKADEPFGASLGDALAAAVEALVANPRSNALARAREQVPRRVTRGSTPIRTRRRDSASIADASAAGARECVRPNPPGLRAWATLPQAGAANRRATPSGIDCEG